MGAHFIDAFNIIEMVNKAMCEWITKAVASQCLTVGEFRVLDSLANGVATTAIECSRHLHFLPSRVSIIVDQLVSHGYIQRRRDRPDRRLVVLQLSDGGLEVYDLALKSLSDHWEEGLTNIDANVMQIIRLLTNPTLAPFREVVQNSLRETDSIAK